MIHKSTISFAMLTMIASPAIADGGNMLAPAQNRGLANVELANRNATLGPKSDAFLNAVQIYHRSEEHTSELQSLMRISYAVFCLQKNNTITTDTQSTLYQTQSHHI